MALGLLIEERYDDGERAANNGGYFLGYCEDEENDHAIWG